MYLGPQLQVIPFLLVTFCVITNYASFCLIVPVGLGSRKGLTRVSSVSQTVDQLWFHSSQGSNVEDYTSKRTYTVISRVLFLMGGMAETLDPCWPILAMCSFQ